jgi:hypothetical protein
VIRFYFVSRSRSNFEFDLNSNKFVFYKKIKIEKDFPISPSCLG